MVGKCFQSVYRLRAQACAQMLDYAPALFGIGVIVRKQRMVARNERPCFTGGEHQRFHGLGQGDGGEFFPQQHEQMIGIAIGRGHADCNAGTPARLMSEIEMQTGGAELPELQKHRQIENQPLGGEQQRFGFMHRCRQVEPGGIMRRQFKRLARIGQIAERAVDFIEQAWTETARHTIAWKPQTLTDRAHAHFRQRADRIRRLVEMLQAQRCQRAAQFVTVVDRGADAGTREQQRATRRGRGGHHALVTQFAQSGADALSQRAQAAKQTQTALDFDQHLMRGRKTHRGRELHRPQRYAFQRADFLVVLEGGELKLRCQRKRRRYQHAWTNARFQRGFVARHYLRTLAGILYCQRPGRCRAAQA